MAEKQRNKFHIIVDFIFFSDVVENSSENIFVTIINANGTERKKS